MGAASAEHRPPCDSNFYLGEEQGEGLGKEAIRKDLGVVLGKRDSPRNQSLRGRRELLGACPTTRRLPGIF